MPNHGRTINQALEQVDGSTQIAASSVGGRPAWPYPSIILPRQIITQHVGYDCCLRYRRNTDPCLFGFIRHTRSVEPLSGVGTDELGEHIRPLVPDGVLRLTHIRWTFTDKERAAYNIPSPYSTHSGEGRHLASFIRLLFSS